MDELTDNVVCGTIIIWFTILSFLGIYLFIGACYELLGF